jgi:hypothetical protein
MNNENQEHEAPKGPVILTIPASLTVPGFGFLVALNTDWRFEGINSDDESSRTRRRQEGRSFSKVLDDFWWW